nr:hypothetical protein [Tanacetum cinerariifolium]
MPNLEDISYPTAVIDMAFVLMVKAFKLNNTTPTNNNQTSSSNPCNRPSVVLGISNHNGNGNVTAARAEGNGNGNNANKIRCNNCQGVGHYARNCTIKPKKRDVAYLQIQLQIA